MFDKSRRNDLNYLLELREKFIAANNVIRICAENRQTLPKAVRQKAHKKAYQMLRDLVEFRGSSLVIRIVLETGHLTCWYTGEPMDFTLLPGGTGPWNQASAEHVVPQARDGKSTIENLVLAQKWINALLGNAPVIVKRNVKEALQRLKFHPECSPEDKQMIQEKCVRSVMESYKIEGDSHFPWEENQGTARARKNGLIAIVSRRRNRMKLIERLGDAAMI